jgi:hypothetical protein
MSDLTLRICRDGDRAALRRLAERDSAEVPAGRLLAADVSGRLLAAISLDSGAVIADPFVRTSDAVDLLRRRARQIRRAEGGRGLGLLSLRRRRPAARTAPAET